MTCFSTALIAFASAALSSLTVILMDMVISFQGCGRIKLKVLGMNGKHGVPRVRRVSHVSSANLDGVRSVAIACVSVRGAHAGRGGSAVAVRDVGLASVAGACAWGDARSTWLVPPVRQRAE